MYLSLRVLPPAVRPGMGLGYLLCRAADTIADTRLVPNAERRGALEAYRAAFSGGTVPALKFGAQFAKHQANPSEVELLTRLDECVALWAERPEAERHLLSEVVFSVADGMRMDLERFPADDETGLRALDSEADLDRYCGLIGGGPGLFWTRLVRLHVPGFENPPQRLEEQGFALGKGLQITNILRDIPKDLRLGRCYLPAPELEAAGLKPGDLLDPASGGKLQPVMRKWLNWALGRLDHGRGYVVHMPSMRLKAAAAWPLILSLKTLELVGSTTELLAPGAGVKVGRREVYGLLAATPWTLSSDDRFLRRYEVARAALAGLL